MDKIATFVYIFIFNAKLRVHRIRASPVLRSTASQLSRFFHPVAQMALMLHISYVTFPQINDYLKLNFENLSRLHRSHDDGKRFSEIFQ